MGPLKRESASQIPNRLRGDLTMTRKINRNPGKTSLGMRCSEYSRASKCRRVGIVVVWDVERICGLGLEALSSVPGHILDHHEGSVRYHEHIESLNCQLGSFM